MLYKFKSRSAPDLIMLEPHGRQILQIVGKTPGPSGIITAAQIPGAMAALEAAGAADEAVAADAQQQADEDGVERPDTVRLRHRAAPFLEMLRRSVAEEHDVVWGA
jgi:cyclopropane-fatty-acyl-phospholipid synthase